MTTQSITPKPSPPYFSGTEEFSSPSSHAFSIIFCGYSPEIVTQMEDMNLRKFDLILTERKKLREYVINTNCSERFTSFVVMSSIWNDVLFCEISSQGLHSQLIL